MQTRHVPQTRICPIQFLHFHVLYLIATTRYYPSQCICLVKLHMKQMHQPHQNTEHASRMHMHLTACLHLLCHGSLNAAAQVAWRSVSSKREHRAQVQPQRVHSKRIIDGIDRSPRMRSCDVIAFLIIPPSGHRSAQLDTFTWAALSPQTLCPQRPSR